MPSISKDQMEPGRSKVPNLKPTTRPTFRNGTILSEVVPVNTLEEAPIKALIYGNNRVGKTTLGAQFPKPLLLISFEPAANGGADSVRSMKGVDFVHIQSTERAIRLSEELSGDTYYKTHVLDTATSLQEVILQDILGRTKEVNIITKGMVNTDQYVRRAEKMRDVLRPYLDLPVNTIILAKEKDHVKQESKESALIPKFVRQVRQESFYSCDVGGGTAGWLQDACKNILRLSVEKRVIITREVTTNEDGTTTEIIDERETGEITRRLRTQYHPNYAAGIRSDNPKCVPEYIESQSPEEMYVLLVRIMKGTYVPS